jgi:hypothetical protein
MLPGLLLRVPAAVPPPEAGMAKVKKAGKKSDAESEAHGVVRVWSIDYNNNPTSLARSLSVGYSLYRQQLVAQKARRSASFWGALRWISRARVVDATVSPFQPRSRT